MDTLTNEEFLKILKNACKTENMDEYLNKTLSKYYPYCLVFKEEE